MLGCVDLCVPSLRAVVARVQPQGRRAHEVEFDETVRIDSQHRERVFGDLDVSSRFHPEGKCFQLSRFEGGFDLTIDARLEGGQTP